MNDLETMLSQFGPADWLLCNDYCGRFLANAADMKAGSRKAKLPAVSGNVAIIPIEGVMTPKGSWFGAGTQAIGRAFDAAMASSQIGGVVFDMDTPGGMSWGTPELAEKIFAARGTKPIVAVANHLSASAGLYVGTAADKFIVAPSGHVGSLGVFRYHVDQSKMLDNEGVRVTFVYAAPYKVEGNPYQPLGEEAKAEMQRQVDDVYGEFVAAVAKHRSTTKKDVLSNYGQGRVLEAKKAVEVGMADRMATLDAVLSELLPADKPKRGRERAEELAAMLCAAWEGTLEPEGEESIVGVPVGALAAARERRAREVA